MDGFVRINHRLWTTSKDGILQRSNFKDLRFSTSESSLLCHLRSSSSSKPGGRSEPAKQPLRKPKLPVGRFDEPEESSMEKEPLEKFPDGINPTTKERGGPRGPEPTRFGDWERKGRCIDF
ncbi:succinate dehydrogenase assembly factor 4, mitochondrial isoform X3 [Hirundo rustica]|uniref:succinate dehydrogenase assembly factor 4, mitochondrial isoform X3 n=1 Tax=Hirundo rustica TaxID=43150 RepID=UPI001A94E745|nr:succinate dehydrogenase assembly factor 4, mitochondrial isoform X3 [Hirundo rustica]